MAGHYCPVWLLFSRWTMDGVAPTFRERFLCFHKPEQFLLLSFDRNAWRALGRRDRGAASRLHRFDVAATGGNPSRDGRHRRLVLAFHGAFVGLYFVFTGVCAVTKRGDQTNGGSDATARSAGNL